MRERDGVWGLFGRGRLIGIVGGINVHSNPSSHQAKVEGNGELGNDGDWGFGE